jgi:hypothetical protein
MRPSRSCQPKTSLPPWHLHRPHLRLAPTHARPKIVLEPDDPPPRACPLFPTSFYRSLNRALPLPGPTPLDIARSSRGRGARLHLPHPLLVFSNPNPDPRCVVSRPTARVRVGQVGQVGPVRPLGTRRAHLRPRPRLLPKISMSHLRPSRSCARAGHSESATTDRCSSFSTM